MQRDVCPLEIHLPDGKRACYIPGTRPPKYMVDGQPTDIDVSIPDDLAALGWIWHGSTLFQPHAGSDGPGVAITTCTYGFPGYADARGTCFDAARTMQRIHVEHEAQRAGKVLAEQLELGLFEVAA